MSKRIPMMLAALVLSAGMLLAAETEDHSGTGTGCETFLDLGLNGGGGEWDYYHTSESGGGSGVGYTRIATLYSRAGHDDKLYGGLTGDYTFHGYCGP